MCLIKQGHTVHKTATRRQPNKEPIKNIHSGIQTLRQNKQTSKGQTEKKTNGFINVTVRERTNINTDIQTLRQKKEKSKGQTDKQTLRSSEVRSLYKSTYKI